MCYEDEFIRNEGAATMPHRQAVLSVRSGPNAGDTIYLDAGTCRLIGRHLSADETVLLGRDGNRLLDSEATDIWNHHLRDRSPERGAVPTKISHETFERGQDIIFSDGSISRAHAMLFYDARGLGIIDLASTNGTFVNAERVTTADLCDGDLVGLGNSAVVVGLR